MANAPMYWAGIALPDAEHFVLGSDRGGHFLRVTNFDWDGKKISGGQASFQTTSTLDANRTAITSMLADLRDQSVYVAGYTTRALPGVTQNQSADVYLAKFDLTGSLLWGIQDDDVVLTAHVAAGERTLLSVDADGNVYTSKVLLAGPATLAKLDRDGTEVWTLGVDFTKRFETLFPGKNGVAGYAHAASSRDGVSYVSASVDLTVADKGVKTVGMLDKVDADGTVLWSIGTTETCDAEQGAVSQIVVAIGTNPSGSEVYTLGSCLTKLDGDGTLVWSRPADGASQSWSVLQGRMVGNARIVVSDDAIYTAAATGADSDPPYTVTKYDTDGNVIWAVPDIGGPVRDFQLSPANDELVFSVLKTPKQLVQLSTADGDYLHTFEQSP